MLAFPRTSWGEVKSTLNNHVRTFLEDWTSGLFVAGFIIGFSVYFIVKGVCRGYASKLRNFDILKVCHDHGYASIGQANISAPQATYRRGCTVTPPPPTPPPLPSTSARSLP